jgi:hypothetical protein
LSTPPNKTLRNPLFDSGRGGVAVVVELASEPGSKYDYLID